MRFQLDAFLRLIRQARSNCTAPLAALAVAALMWPALVDEAANSPCRAEEAGRANTATTGRELFERKWESNDELSPAGDGLGPLFNDTSCVGCHKQGGVGGAGPQDKNVDVVVRMPVTAATPAERQSQFARAEKLHPAFEGGERATGSFVLHRFATSADYEPVRLKLLGMRVPKNADDARLEKLQGAAAQRMARAKSTDGYKIDGLAMKRVQRSTPALWGAGLIDQIAAQSIIAAADDPQRTKFGVRGRVAPAHPERPDPLGDLNDPGNQPRETIGRFGWRGQTGSLRQFVLNACANELGLESTNHAQARTPQSPSYRAPGVDLTREQCNELISFVAQLPRPRQVWPEDSAARRDAEQGATLFESIGCAACHRPTLGNVDGFYSDLLLHDVGPELADPVGANPPSPTLGLPVALDKALAGLVPPGVIPNLNAARGGVAQARAPIGGAPQVPFGPGGPSLDQIVSLYTGGSVTSQSSLQQEWRTPPLWGVRDSAPYMHDGRAATLDEAIKLHGGEANQVTAAYKRLSNEDRRKLLSFLDTLAAPADAVSVRP